MSQVFTSGETYFSVVSSNSVVWGFSYQTSSVFLPFQRIQRGERERGKEGERKKEMEGGGDRGKERGRGRERI